MRLEPRPRSPTLGVGPTPSRAHRLADGWAAFNVLDLAATLLKLRELRQLKARVEARLHAPPVRLQAGAEEARRLLLQCQQALRLHLVRALCFLLPALQYSLPDGSRLAVQPAWFGHVCNLCECAIGYYTFWSGLSCSRPGRLEALLQDQESKQA